MQVSAATPSLGAGPRGSPAPRRRTVTAAVTVRESHSALEHVAIVGAGVGGLTLAVALQRLCPRVKAITIYEQYQGRSDDAAGAAFNLNGGAAVLHDLGLGRELKGISNPMRRVRGRTVDGLQLLDVDVEKAVRECGGEEALRREGRSMCVTVLRSELLGLLSQAAVERPGGAQLLRGAAVTAVGAEGRLSLSDGSQTGPHALVIGCDGLRSAVRKATGSAAEPKYSGIRIKFAVAPRTQDNTADALRPDPSEVHQWFAKGAYALAFSAGAPSAPGGAHCLALCWQEEQPAPENASWSSSDAQKDLLRRLHEGAFPSDILRLARASTRIFEIGVRHHEPLTTSWSNEAQRIVLMGDACHAMPPFLGQGANQAIQDAYCLAARLQAEDDVAEALRQYEQRRRPVTSNLQVSSKYIGLLDTLPAPWHPLRDAALWFAGASGVAARVFVAGALPRV